MRYAMKKFTAQLAGLKKIGFLPLLALSLQAVSQDLHVGIFAGISNYYGDLSNNIVDFPYSRPGLGIFARKDINRFFSARIGFNYGVLTASDATSSDPKKIARNLSFRSDLFEIHIIGEYNLFDFNNAGYTPYLFAGVAGFYFNPSTLDAKGNRVYLQPLGTEGQGLPGYPNRKPYSLYQMGIPFGIGLKYALSEKITLGAEIGLRYTFTDYLDDVSTTYVDQNALRNGRGQLAVDLAYRGNDVPVSKGGNPVYPPDGTQRGTSPAKDMYSFSGFTLTFKIGDKTSLFSKYRKGVGCPSY